MKKEEGKKEEEKKVEEEKKIEEEKKVEEEEKKKTDSLENYHSFDFDIDSIQPIEKKEKPKVNSTQRRRVGLSLAQYLAETNN